MARLAIYLLGPPYVEVEGEALEIPRRKLWALLACLALNHAPLQRDTLAALIWPDVEQSRARMSLSRHLSELRQLLGDAQLRIEHERISLQRSPDLWLDVDEFRHRTSSLTASLTSAFSGSPSGTKANSASDLASLSAAVLLYRAEFLSGFSLSDSPEFDDWQALQSEDLQRTLALCLAALVNGSLAQWTSGAAAAGESMAALLPFAQRWLALDNLHEPAHCQLMRLYARTGQAAAAIRQYRLCAQLLADEFQGSPSAETTTLYREILQSHFPAQASAASASERKVPLSPRHNLSPPLTRFVGREEELARLERLLVNPDVRLVTIQGQGGIGKSRLAMEAAARNRERFADGVWFVALAPLETPQVQSALHPLAVALVDMLPATFHGDGSLTEQLMSFLENKEMLIIYDNFEQLLASAPFVSDLLQRAPKVKVLATSRSRLNLQEEWLFVLEGLPVPSDSALAHSENLGEKVGQKMGGKLSDKESAELGSAVALFVQHASRVRQDFDLAVEQAHVLQICRLVEGMPLGIELAAPWVRMMSGAEIAAEIERNLDFLATTMHNIPERHRSLRALFDHSWRLLAANEQAVLMRLAILHGFARAEAAVVAGATLNNLSMLVDHSFLQVTAEGRYSLHAHLRQFAADQLERVPSAYSETSDLHAQTYLRFVQREGLRLYGSEVKQAVAAISADIENVRAAWRWALDHDRYGDLASTVEGLGTFYEIKGWYADARALFAQTVARLRPQVAKEGSRKAGTVVASDAPEVELRTVLLAAVLTQLGWFLTRLGLQNPSREAIDESIALFAAMEAPPIRQQALAYAFLGYVMIGAGTAVAAIVPFERSYDLFAQVDDRYSMGLVRVGLCQANVHLGHYDDAERVAQQSLALSNEIGEQVNKGYALSTLARVAYSRGHFALSEVLNQECLHLRMEIGDLVAATFTLRHLGETSRFLGRMDQARHYLERCLAQSEALNLPESTRLAYYGLGQIALDQNEIDEALRLFQAGLLPRTESADLYVWPGNVGLGRVALAQGDLVTSKRQLQISLTLMGRDMVFCGLHPFAAWIDYLAQSGAAEEAIVTASFLLHDPSFVNADRDIAQRHLVALAATLPAAVFAALRARGEGATWDEIVAAALTDFAG